MKFSTGKIWLAKCLGVWVFVGVKKSIITMWINSTYVKEQQHQKDEWRF